MKPTTTTILLALAAFAIAPISLRAAPPDRLEAVPVLVLDLNDPMPATTPTPGPTVLQPVIIQPAQNFQAAATSWVNAIAAVLMVIVTVLLPAFAVLWSKVREVTKRQDRQAAKQGQITDQVTQLAAAAPPTVITPGNAAPSSATTTVAIILLTLLPWGLIGCATTGPNAARDAGIRAAGSQALAVAGKVLTQAAINGLLNAAQQEISGGKVDFTQAAAQGLWANVNAADTVADVRSIASAYSAGKAMQTARAAAIAYQSALDNGVEPPQAINAIASVISTATGAPPRK